MEQPFQGLDMAYDKVRSIRDQIKNLRDQRDKVARQPCISREDRIVRAEAITMIDQTIQDLERILRSTKPPENP
jgi:hypothetical protein